MYELNNICVYRLFTDTVFSKAVSVTYFLEQPPTFKMSVMRCFIFSKVFLSLLLCFGSTIAVGQYHNVWAFGLRAGIDFNVNPPQPFEAASGSMTGEAGASVCDEYGRLLFYTEGDRVYDRNHQVMPTGRNVSNNGSTASSAQGALIVPMPGNPDKYYLFSMKSWESGRASVGTLVYCIVDMTRNNGLGSVVDGPIQLDSFLTEHMTSVPGENCDVWLVVVNRKKNSFKAYNISEKGIDTLPVVSPGLITKELFSDDEMIGHIAFSPDGKKLAIMQDRALLYQFDANTGNISHPITLYVLPAELRGMDALYGVCFSPDNSKLYYSIRRGDEEGLYQYDLSSGDSATIINSKRRISEHSVMGMQRAPDGKIYCASGHESRHALSVIHYPNLSGAACKFVYGDFPLYPGTESVFGVPNILSYAGKNDEPKISSNPVNVCFQPSISLSPSMDDSRNLQWSTGDTGRVITVQYSGTYWVQYKRSCYIYTDTFHVDIFNPKVETKPACFNQGTGAAYVTFDFPVDDDYRAYWMNAEGDTISLKDSLDHLPAGNYTVHIFSEKSCDKIIHFSIGILDYRLAFSPVDSVICAGDTVQFRNQSHNYYTSFQWQLDTGTVTTATNPVHVFDRPGVYAIMLAGVGERCRDTAYGTITADVPWSSLYFEADKKEICRGESILFIPDITEDSTLLSFLWETGDGNIISSDDKMIRHAYDTDGRFPVSLTARFRACPDINSTDTISVHPVPLINLGTDSVICLNSAPITIQNLNPEEDGDSYLWSTGAITKSIQATHHDEYWLRVNNPFGCMAEEHIKISKDCDIDIPNAFTPNDDGVNDYFIPKQLLAEGVTRFYMQVFNRLGQKVFETANTKGRGWDGKFNGKEQPGGVYIYIIEAVFSNGREERYVGNVTLIR